MNLIVLFGKSSEAKAIRTLLLKNGYETDAVCTTGAQALAEADSLDGGVIVAGYRYPDMIYSELFELLPDSFELLLLASERIVSEGVPEGIPALSMPLKTMDLIATLGMMEGRRSRRKRKERNIPRTRSAEDRAVIDKAKELLMERNHMDEPEAHRYLQKCSMESGNSMSESAAMVLAMAERDL
ncbi:MAG: ANTAR domain-containing protein [Lachnospiraceae bacterium]|nr:ANTAR domain-containing protein [Lachnospiraceae bacterium]